MVGESRRRRLQGSHDDMMVHNSKGDWGRRATQTDEALTLPSMKNRHRHKPKHRQTDSTQIIKHWPADQNLGRQETLWLQHQSDKPAEQNPPRNTTENWRESDADRKSIIHKNTWNQRHLIDTEATEVAICIDDKIRRRESNTEHIWQGRHGSMTYNI